MAAVQPNQFKIAFLFLLYLAFVWTLHRFLAALPGLKKVWRPRAESTANAHWKRLGLSAQRRVRYVNRGVSGTGCQAHAAQEWLVARIGVQRLDARIQVHVRQEA